MAITIPLFLFVAAPLQSMEPVKGGINWTGGYIRGVGSGTAKPSGSKGRDRMMAIRAAEVMAQRALAETINGVKVDGATSMRDAMKDTVVQSRVEGVIRGAQKFREEVAWEGDVPLATVELRICLVADAPECRGGASVISTLAVKERVEPSYVPAVYFEDIPEEGKPEAIPKGTPKTEAVSYDSSRPVTGLVLKTEGLPHEKELFPVVVTRVEGGKLQTVFSAKSVKPDVVRTYGVNRYADSVDLALKDSRLGDNPLVVPVSEVTRENMLLIRVDGARAIRETTRYGNDYLADAKVIIAGGRQITQTPSSSKPGL